MEGAVMPAAPESTVALLDNKQIMEMDTTRVIFFAGNAVVPSDQYEQPVLKGFGGIFLPQLQTLQHDGNPGMLYRCKFTPLRTTMIKDLVTMVPPEQRTSGLWTKAFTKSVVVDGKLVPTTIDGFMESVQAETRQGRFATQKNDHLLFRKRYPGQEIRRATERSLPNGIGGVVELTSLKGASQAEIDAAQLFYFPDWPLYIRGEKNLFKTIRETEEHIRERMAAISPSDPLRAKYRQIGLDMLKSCSEYRRTGLDLVNKDEKATKRAFTEGETGAVYSEISSVVLEMLEHRRKEDALTGESSSVDGLTRELREERLAKAKEDEKRLNLEERKQYLAEVQAGIRERDEAEEIRLGMKKTASVPYVSNAVEPIPSVTTTTTFVPETEWQEPTETTEIEVVTADVGIRLCGKPTAAGTACERPLKDDENACFQHK